jgi:lambda family phage portal protein
VPRKIQPTKTAAKARTRKAPAGGRRMYAGAQVSRLTGDWVFSACSPEQELKTNLRRLRLRARDLQRNSPTVRWYLTLLKANVIGKAAPHLEAQTRIGGPEGDLDKATNSYIERRFATWGKAVTADGRLNLVRFLWQVCQSLAVDGEVFVRRVVGYPHNEFGFALQLLEPDLLDENLNTEALRGRPDVRLGVEVDEWQRPVAYHFADRYPEDARAKTQRIPAGEVLHLFDHDRCQQTRGVTWTKAILVALKMLDGFFEAELVASRASAQKIAGLKYDSPDAFEAPNPEDGPVQIDSSPGEFFTIPPGMSLETWDPQHPNAAFGAFVKSSQRMLASGLGTFYNSLANDAEGVSWSSMRSFLLIERDVWQMVQTMICETLLPWIFDGWLETSTLSGAVRLPAADWRTYREHTWMPRGWQWVDPASEAKAAQMQLASGITSPQRVLAPQGIELESVLEELAEWRAMCATYGLDADKFQAAWSGGSPAASTLNDAPPQNDNNPAASAADGTDA